MIPATNWRVFFILSAGRQRNTTVRLSPRWVFFPSSVGRSICRTRYISPGRFIAGYESTHAISRQSACARTTKRKDEKDDAIRRIGFFADDACSARLNSGSFGLLRLIWAPVQRRRELFRRSWATARRRASISRGGRWRLLGREALSPQEEIVAACPYCLLRLRLLWRGFYLISPTDVG